MTGFSNSPKLLKGGIVVIDRGTSQLLSSIALKYSLVTPWSLGVFAKNLKDNWLNF